MSSLNLSTNGQEIQRSYQAILGSAAPSSSAAASSQTYGQWAVYSVSAPLANAFQQDSGKESVLKVQSTGEGELVDLVEDFSDGKIQFAFVKVKDPNTTLPKNVLICWCGEGVPERTKGYFANHQASVAKLFQSYHVQITARSDRDLSPEMIVQKVSDSSGSKYSGGGSVAPAPAPPTASKPAFMPTQSSGNVGFNPLANRSRASKQENVDADGWGTDAPQVTRTQLEKVQPAYQRTVVDMGHLGSGRDDSRQADFSRDGSGNPDVVKGAYQPVGKVDIAALRRQAQDTEKSQDDRPTAVKGAYEPVGKVDIAAIRARAQQPAPESSISPEPTGASADSSQEPRGGVAERSAAFNAPERLTTLPKPKVANRFGGGSGTFAGTKAPTPGGFGLESKKSPSAAPIGASRNFADQSGKTPAQLWAEKKAQQGGAPVAPGSGGLTSPQSGGAAKSGGEWKSGYTGKSWAPVQPTKASKSMPTGESQTSEPAEREAPADAAPEPPVSGGVGAMRDRFKDAPPMGAQAPGTAPRPPSPPPLETSTKPNAGRGVPIPGIAQPPPAAAAPEPDEDADADAGSPIQVAMPVSRAAPEPGDEALAARSPPPAPVPQPVDAPAARNKTPPPRSPSPPTAAAGAGEGARALAQYDYAKAEDNELELREGELVTHIEMVDPDWWMGTNARGEQGLFPSNYVEVVPDEDDAGAAGAGAGVSPLAVASEPPAAPSAGAAAATASAGATATAQYDYEAAEDNELSFPEGAKITHVEFPDDDWWSGEYGGRAGLFPANYVELNE